MDHSLRFDSAGRCEEIKWIPSPNYDTRPDNTLIDLLVLHYISLPAGQFGTNEVTALFTNTLDTTRAEYSDLQGLRVSAHFFITRPGEINQFVACQDRAWHAGISYWQGRTACNDFSIGIELEGDEYTPYTQAQYDALLPLMMSLKRHYPLQQVVGHQDIAPGRKTDPGPFFDWARIHAHWANN